jgi:ribonuclease BN (tRNA processing enzyme)
MTQEGADMKLTVVGCSDAFGTGGRLQTCFHVAAWGAEFLIDCGATALIGLDRLGIDPNRIGTIFITHLHGDHFGGLVWWMIHANHISGRTTALTVVGPAGIEARFNAAAEALYPGSTATPRKFELLFRELTDRVPLDIGGVRVTPFEVVHPSGAPPYALRFEVEGRAVAFSGDTEWVESLIPAAQGTDLFIAECYGFEQEARSHMHWRIIERNLDRLGARKVLITHMGADMLGNLAAVTDRRVIAAWDGLTLEI